VDQREEDIGRPLATYDSIRHEIADILVLLEGTKLLALKVLDMCSKGGDAKYGVSEMRGLSWMAKLYGTEVAMSVLRDSSGIGEGTRGAGIKR
jgi:alkylation response protein AidB-like acyl-CoA dehydrogenase